MHPNSGKFNPKGGIYTQIWAPNPNFKIKMKEMGNLCGLEPQLIKLEFIIYLPKLKVSRACRPSFARILGNLLAFRAGRPRTTL